MGFQPAPAKSVPFPFTEDLKSEMPKNFQAVEQDLAGLVSRATLLEAAGGLHPWKDVTLMQPAFQSTWTNYGADFWQWAQFRRVGDMVEVRGLVRTGADNTSVFILPPGYRPTADLIFPVDSASIKHARVDIDSAGNVIGRLGAGGGTTGYFSLSWIRFSVASAFSEGFYQVGTTGVAFQNSWTNFGVTFHNAEYRLDGDEVQLRGLVKGGADGSTIFTLPLGMRPQKIMHFNADMNSAQHALIRVLPTGEVKAHGANVAAYVSLSNVAFSVSGQGTNGWKALTLLNSFTRFDADHPLPEYRVNGDIVELRGLAAKNASVGIINVAQIPDRAAWSVQRNMWSTEGSGAPARVDVFPDGLVVLTGGTGTYLSLNGFRYSILP